MFISVLCQSWEFDPGRVTTEKKAGERYDTSKVKEREREKRKKQNKTKPNDDPAVALIQKHLQWKRLLWSRSPSWCSGKCSKRERTAFPYETNSSLYTEEDTKCIRQWHDKASLQQVCADSQWYIMHTCRTVTFHSGSLSCVVLGLYSDQRRYRLANWTHSLANTHRTSVRPWPVISSTERRKGMKRRMKDDVHFENVMHAMI